MERKNQTEEEILSMKESRFSGEQRARMAQESAFARREMKKEFENANHKNDLQKKAQIQKTKKQNSQKKQEGSRNDRVKTSTAQRKKESKRKNNLAVAMLFVVVIALMGIAVAFVLKINAIEVSGSERYSKDSVISAVNLRIGDSMVLFNSEAKENEISVKLPFIESAEIKRVWPDTIKIVLTDAVATLAVDTGNGYVLMNDTCKVLDDDAVVLSETAALIKGVKISSAVPGETVVFSDNISTDNFCALVDSLLENEITGISLYDLTSISSVKLEIDHRIEVNLGTLAGAASKLDFCKEVIEKTVASDKKHPMIIDFTSDGKAYAKAKNDNNVNYGESLTQEEFFSYENTTQNYETVTNSESQSQFSVG